MNSFILIHCQFYYTSIVVISELKVSEFQVSKLEVSELEISELEVPDLINLLTVLVT